jgi:hypothetical protein
MAKFMELKIDNSQEAAIMTGKWKAPGAAFYDQLLNAFYCEGGIPDDAKELDKAMKEGRYTNWKDYLQEAYLIAPVKNIQNSPHGVTPFSRSGCKYPHHVIRNGKLVVSVPGIKAAYARALQMGVLKGDMRKHLERHIRELGMQVSFKSGNLSWNESVDFGDESISGLDLMIDEVGMESMYESDADIEYPNENDGIEGFDERSHGKLKQCYRCVYDKDKNAYQIIFDLKPEDIKFAGTHDPEGKDDGIHSLDYTPTKPRTSVVRTEGDADFVSQSTVKQIIKLDTGEHVNSVTAIGIDYRSTKPVTYVVGQKEPTQSFKSTSRQNVGFDPETGKIEYHMGMERINDDIKAFGQTWIPGYGPVKKVRHMDSTPSNAAPTKTYRNALALFNQRKEEVRHCNHEWVDLSGKNRTAFQKYPDGMSQCKKCGVYRSPKGGLSFNGTKDGKLSVDFDALMDQLGSVEELHKVVDNKPPRLWKEYADESIIDPEVESTIERNFDSIYQFIKENAGIDLSDQDNWDEASHGLLKNDFKLGWDYDTGHQVKVVYSLDKDTEVTDVGDFYPGYSHTSKEDYLADTKANIRKKGNLDHQSKNQKVLAIVDVATSARMKRTKLVSPICPNLNTRVKVQPDMDEFHRVASADGGRYIHQLEVGMMDQNPSFKSTHWFSGDPVHPTTGEDYRFRQLSSAERYKDGRGHKIDNLSPFDYTIHTGPHSGEYPMFRNPNRKQAMQQLIILAHVVNERIERCADIIKTGRYPDGLDRATVMNYYNRYCQDAARIREDYETIKAGKYSPDMMNKYLESIENPDRQIPSSYEEFVKGPDYYRECYNLGIRADYPAKSIVETEIQQEMAWIDRVAHGEPILESADPIESPNELMKQCETPEELLKWMDCIKYGWLDSKGKYHGTDEDDDKNLFFQQYHLQSAAQVIKSKVGVCWDQAELERYWFAHEHDPEREDRQKYVARMLYLELQDGKSSPSHTCVIYQERWTGLNTVWWFEHSWGDQKGIHEYKNTEECLNDIVSKFRKSWNDFDSPLEFHVFDTVLHREPKPGSTCEQYMKKAKKSSPVIMDDGNLDEFFEATISPSPDRYDPPMGYDQLPEHLKGDPIHAWRANSGIELIHKEPSREELERIWANWNLMTPEMKAASDSKSMELFGCSNADNYRALASQYESDDILDERIDEYDERSHGKLKYCYRIGFDAKTGKQVAVKFVLEPDKITNVAAPENITNAAIAQAKLFTPKMIKQKRADATTEVRKIIRRKGYIDFISGNMMVDSIFYRNGNSVQTVELIPMYSPAVSEIAGEFQKYHKNKYPGNHDSEIDQMCLDPEFNAFFADQVGKHRNQIKTETYHAGAMEGANHYKTTKLLWGYDLFASYKFSPVMRGYNEQPGNYDNDMKNYNMLNKFEPTIESMIDIPEDRPGWVSNTVYTERSKEEMECEYYNRDIETELLDQVFWEQCTQPNPWRDRVHKAALKSLANQEGVKQLDYDHAELESVEQEIESSIPKNHQGYTIDTLPDIMYFGSRNPHEVVQGDKVFLTPYKGIASIFTIDVSKTIADWYEKKTGHAPERVSFNTSYREWEAEGVDLVRPLRHVHITHNIPEITETIKGKSLGYIHCIDVSKIKDQLKMFPASNDSDREVYYDGGEPLVPVEIIKHRLHWEMKYSPENEKHHGTGIVESGLTYHEGLLTGDVFTEEGTEPPPEMDANPQEESKPESLPKQTDKAESPKNGVRRKKLYVAFIEWAKDYNPKNTFGSLFDKDAFKVSYPFVPEEMRYFYRLANPLLCVLSGDLTFFPVSELRKVNAKNTKLNELMIFAATQNDMRVFNQKDKKVYRATEENGELALQETLGDTFDTYIQKMINKGDILNGPIEPAEPAPQ